MNGYDLVASLVQSVTSLAWPAAAVVCVYLFREKLNEILPRLHFRHKETEISFRLDAAAEEAERLPQPASENVPEQLPITERALRLAEISPSGLIWESWTEIESALRNLSKSQMPEGSQHGRTILHKVIIELLRRGIVDETTFKLYDDLRKIRNEVAHHGSKPTFEDALRYYDLSQVLLANLRLTPEQPL